MAKHNRRENANNSEASESNMEAETQSFDNEAEQVVAEPMYNGIGDGSDGVYTLREGEWEYVESHVGALDIIGEDKQRHSVPKNEVLLGEKYVTSVNRKGWRYFSRRPMPSLNDHSVNEWLDELEKFDNATELYVPEQNYVDSGITFHLSERRIPKNFKIFVNQKGEPVTKDEFHKLALTGAVKLLSQKAMQNKLREKATEELRDELNLGRPIAGQRGRKPMANGTVVQDTGESMDF